MAEKNADRVVLGLGACPVCANPKAVFKVSAKQLAYCTCNACNTQIFSRSDVGDMALRGFLHAGKPAPAAPAAEPVKTPAPAPAPAPAAAAAVVPEQRAPEPVKTETKKPAAPGWGILGAFNG